MSQAAKSSVSPALVIALAAVTLLAVFVYARPLLDPAAPDDPGVSLELPVATVEPAADTADFTLPSEPRNPFRPAGDDSPALSLDQGAFARTALPGTRAAETPTGRHEVPPAQ